MKDRHSTFRTTPQVREMLTDLARDEGVTRTEWLTGQITRCHRARFGERGSKPLP